MDDTKLAAADGKTGSGFSPTQFVNETRREIAKVTWPTRRETVMTTVLIIFMAIIVGLFFFAVDSMIGFGVSRLLGMKE